jgi:hypothetical protein
MRRPLLAAASGAAMLLLAVPAAGATPVTSHARAASPVIHSRAAQAEQHRLPFRFVPLGRRLTGAGTIDLTVKKYDGTVDSGAQASWSVTSRGQFAHGTGTTDASGQVAMHDVPAAAAAGEIAVLPNTADGGVFDLSDMTWGDSGWAGTLQPGRLSLSLMHSDQSTLPPWPYAVVNLYSGSGAETHAATTFVTRDGSQTHAAPSTIPLAAGEDLTTLCINWWSDMGSEVQLTGKQTSPGVTTTTTDKYWEDTASFITLPGWASGKPGTKTTLYLGYFPLGWTNRIGAVADYPATATPKSYGDLPSDGMTYQGMDLTIPASMPPGYSYWVWADHVEGHLSLTTSFQTCTLKPSKTSVAKGNAVTLSGVVPIQGHYGNHKGTPKTVTIYWTTNAKLVKAGQPSKPGGTPHVDGWMRAGTARTDRLGKYVKAGITPARTTYYVAWYPKDAEYFGAWTSLTKVTVR